MVLFSNAWGQEKYDAEGPIQGGFRHDTTARLLISKYNHITGEYNAYSWSLLSHHIAVIDVYSVVGWVYTYYMGSREDIPYYFPFPRGIYFIKVGEQIKVFYLTPGEKIIVMFLNYF
jgi:hypothetical protein